MAQQTAQRGHTRFGTLVLLLLVGGAIYLGVVFWPVFRTYYSVRTDLRALANRILSSTEGDHSASHVRWFLQRAAGTEGLTLTRSDLDIQRPSPGTVSITLPLSIPYSFPIADIQRRWKTQITAKAKH